MGRLDRAKRTIVKRIKQVMGVLGYGRCNKTSLELEQVRHGLRGENDCVTIDTLSSKNTVPFGIPPCFQTDLLSA